MGDIPHRRDAKRNTGDQALAEVARLQCGRWMEVVRFAWSDVVGDPATVARRLRALLVE